MISTIMNKMINYFDGDTPRINHALKVYSFAKTIAELEDMDKETLTTIEISAILHDIGIKISEQKYGSSSAKYQELEGPIVAAELLADINIKDDIFNRVLYLIGNHHSYANIDNIDFQILVEADFLVNIYEGSMSEDSIKSVINRYFKTESGTKIAKSLYC